MESFTNAQADVENRLLIEAREEGRQIIFFTEKFLQNHSELLTNLQVKDIQDLIDALNHQITSGTKSDIHTSIEHLEKYTRPFAELVMDQAVRKAMVGKAVAD